MTRRRSLRLRPCGAPETLYAWSPGTERAPGVNEGPTEAISLHLYGYDHTAHATSIHREYRLARH